MIPATMMLVGALGTGKSEEAAHPPPTAWRMREMTSQVTNKATYYAIDQLNLMRMKHRRNTRLTALGANIEYWRPRFWIAIPRMV